MTTRSRSSGGSPRFLFFLRVPLISSEAISAKHKVVRILIELVALYAEINAVTSAGCKDSSSALVISPSGEVFGRAILPPDQAVYSFIG